jgi:hypothetical protein
MGSRFFGHPATCSARNNVSSQGVRSLVVANEVCITVGASEFEVSVVGRQTPSATPTRRSPRISVRGVCSPR